MKSENPTASHAEKAAEKPAEVKSEVRSQSKVEARKYGALRTDISEYGEPKLHTMASDAHNPIEASHIVINVEAKNLNKFDVPAYFKPGDVFERPVSGTVKNNETGASEQYKYSYVERPDGHVEPSRLESKYNNGETEVLDREFDKDGRVTKETDILNGKLVREFVNKYDENGKFVEQSVRNYDQNGKLIDEKAYKQAAKMSGQKSVAKGIPGRGFQM